MNYLLCKITVKLLYWSLIFGIPLRFNVGSVKLPCLCFLHKIFVTDSELWSSDWKLLVWEDSQLTQY
jgi:hypothetical protein